ncbi:Beta-galactosidase [Drechslerella dactyloides]|uniref:Beta-galactosidase n=1 Tax=Drechslerella dactyloides TaxID=74499 RepID=A0AAD6J7R6_DREDA|nr:Beta-galactosidase [Drechslerella dactyloides]
MWELHFEVSIPLKSRYRQFGQDNCKMRRLLLLLLLGAAAVSAHNNIPQVPLGGDVRPHSAAQRVTWDEQSLFIDGRRTFIFSGEVHPWRYLAPFPTAGFNAVSIYFHWGAVEYERGVFRWNKIFDLQPFLDAAKQAGLYVIARPGPYFSSAPLSAPANSTRGGFPGWGTRVEGLWRKSNENYTAAYKPFVREFGALIAKNEITRGGPIILVQVENEYSGFGDGHEDFKYEEELLAAFKDAGITVPTICDDAWLGGNFQSVDIYGWNSYPLGFDCSHPEVWHSAPPDYFYNLYNSKIRRHAPKSILELQAGGFDGWGGAGYDACGKLIGPEFERVFYKGMYGSAVSIMNLYMVFGGTNWGQLAEPGVYTSYDYGAIIREDRRLRDKYYELKLQTNFLKVSPTYLTSAPWQLTERQQTDILKGTRGVVLTVLEDTHRSRTKFYIISRQKDFSKFKTINYRIDLDTSVGSLAVPRLKSGTSLELQPRDSNILVTDYRAGSAYIIYSTAEIYTWQEIDGMTYIFVYGDPGEQHEAAFRTAEKVDVHIAGSGDNIQWNHEADKGLFAFSFPILEDSSRRTIRFGMTALVIQNRELASKTWILDTEPPAIVQGGYLIRSATKVGSKLHLTGDLTEATRLEILAPKSVSHVTLNGKDIDIHPADDGWLSAVYKPRLPDISIPELSKLNWKVADSLPEIGSSYDDSRWVTADNTYTPNKEKPSTEHILYASDYGFHSGNILWRGHFKASGGEQEFSLKIQGGQAFGYSVWDNDVYLGFWEGDVTTERHTGTFKLPKAWKADSKHVITILQDHMGLEENWTAATEDFKAPRGLFEHNFKGSSPKLGHWKYIDLERGPFNEGGLYAERQGWHLPGFDDSDWSAGSPLTGLKKPGVAFYRWVPLIMQLQDKMHASFDLSVPAGVDYPMAIEYSNSTGSYYRSQIYINTSFFIPQGILNYNGTNTIGISLWAMQPAGAQLKSLDLRVLGKVEGGVGTVENSPMPPWTKRDAY